MTHKGKSQQYGHLPRFWKAWAVDYDRGSQHQPFCSQKPGSRAAPWTAHDLCSRTEQSNSTTAHTCQPTTRLQQCQCRWAQPRGESTRLCYCTVSLQLDLTAHKTDASFSCSTQLNTMALSSPYWPQSSLWHQPRCLFLVFNEGGNGKLKMLILVINPVLKLNTIQTNILILIVPKNGKT